MQRGRHALGSPASASPSQVGFHEAVHVVPLDLIEPQHARQRVEYQGRGMRVAAAFEAEVVVGADSREHRNLLTAKAMYPAVPARQDASLFRRDESAPSAQVGSEPATFGVLGHAKTLSLGPAG
jgi:hypothetical protein